jgi:hypothetical protein
MYGHIFIFNYLRNKFVFLGLKLFKAFIDRDLANLANGMDRLLGHVQVTFLTHKVDDARRDRMRRILGDNLLCLDHVRNEQAQ